MSDGSRMTLYADDVLLYQMFQDDINSISEWVSENHFCFNVNKYKCMLISRRRNPPKLSVCGQVQVFGCTTHLRPEMV